MKAWLVVVRDEARVYKALAKAKEAYQDGIRTHWEECIKFSCPKNEFYDDSYQTFKECLNGTHATINRHEYSIKAVIIEED